MLCRADRIELAHLHEVKAVHVRFFQVIQCIFISEFSAFLIVPVVQDQAYKMQKILRCFSGWQACHTVWIFGSPFQKRQCGKQSQLREAVHRDIRHSGGNLLNL